MKKVMFLMIGVLALGLVFAGCGEIMKVATPSTTEKGVIPTGPGSLSVVSDSDVMITKVYNNKDHTGAVAVVTSSKCCSSMGT